MTIFRGAHLPFVLGSLLVHAAALAQPTTYQYEGSKYLTPTGAFTASMGITGWFRTASPLPANITADIGPNGDGRAIAWSFNDGLTTFTEADSLEFYGTASYFRVKTDGSGNVTNYWIALMSPLPPHTTGTTMEFFYISHASQVQALYQGTCGTVTGSLCTFIPFAGAGTVNDTTESGKFVTSSLPIPALSLGAAALLVALLALFGVLAARRR